MLSGLAELQHLNLENNFIVDTHPDAFKDLVKLREVKMSKNQISFNFSKFKSPFENSKKLRVLHFAHNLISSIYDDWTALMDLEHLDLSHNNISILEVGIYLYYYIFTFIHVRSCYGL